MAFLVSNADSDAIHSFTHGVLSRDDLSYFRNRVHEAARTATGYASKYLERARETLENFDLSGLRRSVDRLRERFGKRWDEDRITALLTVPSLRDAKPTMRRYAMAMPRLRTLYMKGRVEGYDGDFQNDEPGFVGVMHDDYRNVMTGSYIGNEEEDRWITHLMPDDEEALDHFEREYVRETWCFQDLVLDEGIHDTTSRIGNTL